MNTEWSPCQERGHLFALCSVLGLNHKALLSIYTQVQGKCQESKGTIRCPCQGPSHCRPGMRAFETARSLTCHPRSFQLSDPPPGCRQKLGSDGSAPRNWTAREHTGHSSGHLSTFRRAWVIKSGSQSEGRICLLHPTAHKESRLLPAWPS